VDIAYFRTKSENIRQPKNSDFVKIKIRELGVWVPRDPRGQTPNIIKTHAYAFEA
jgi:hypothetical protein